MNFYTIVIAVIVGLLIYKYIIEEALSLWAERREHRRLLKWKKECEDGINKGKDVEMYKAHLKTVDALLIDFYKKHTSI